ncbi:MAG TPA: Rrf2 family transcriptional regulator [Spirochaetales bacterium]|nr:Rrf2 family transcriptional regulator [Spirochaetales bacterium]HRY56402.1 Rrf2 family transcriptional regulator [Spirochaetia bacterium]HRZ66284.1 Rrf2 family transcriptional regulator [Spirochaetia bacterium]
MSLISTRSRYGLRLLVELAERGASGPVDLKRIASSQEIPEPYLAKLVAPLKAAGLLRASRGAKGGYELARRPEDIDLLTVVEALEGRSSLLECTAEPELCPRSGDCRTLPIWRGLDRAVKDYLRGRSVADAARSPAPDYAI